LSRNLDPREPAGFPWKKLLLIVFVAGSFFSLGAGTGVLLLAKFGDFPSIGSAAAYRPSVTSKIFDRENRVVGEIYLEKRNVVPFKAIPPHVVQAFVAAEDANFFKHSGVDYIAIARAVVKDVLSGGFAQGASTITQQTVKSLFLTPEKTIGRKLKELILAYRIERKLTKEEILYLYLNQIYLGDGAYGVEAAAQTYFSRGVSTLTVAEGALLAGLAQAPSRYSPRGHIDKARARQRYVLRRMAEVGFIDKEAADRAYKARMALAPPSTFRSKAAYFLEHVRNYLQEKYGTEAMYRSEFKIYTTIDARLQEAAYDAVTQGIRRMEEANRYRGLQGALLCMAPGTGGVLAMVGGVDFAASQFNRALQARRQPGFADRVLDERDGDVEAEELRRNVPRAHSAAGGPGQVPQPGDRPAPERDRRGRRHPDGPRPRHPVAHRAEPVHRPRVVRRYAPRDGHGLLDLRRRRAQADAVLHP
jgi:penicillin-binding protein 1A